MTEPISGTELGIFKIDGDFVIARSGTEVCRLTETAMMALLQGAAPLFSPDALAEMFQGVWAQLGNELREGFAKAGEFLAKFIREGGPFPGRD